MDRVEQNRLKWKCRRGLLELDLVLERFLRRNALQGAQAEAFARLLDLPDNELWDIVVGRRSDYGGELEDVVVRLRAA